MEALERGSLIRTKRKQKGWSQEELAEKVGVSRNAIYAWENGIHDITLDKAIALAKALDVDEAEIVTGKDLSQLDAETKEALNIKFRELSEQIDSVQNITINIEDHGIASFDIAITALAFAFFATAMGIWAVFPHTMPNKICSWIIATLGIVVLVFGKRIVKILERQLKERSQKN